MVFGGLNLTNPSEAFDLSSGSVRTLLAVGVILLFAGLGLRFFTDAGESGRVPRLSDQPPAQIEVSLAASGR
jgi:hypothetical protein